MAKKFTMTILVIFPQDITANAINFKLLLLKKIPLAYHHSHCLATTLYFTSLVTMVFFLTAAQFFYSWAVLAYNLLLFL